jgi:hypothetical protein
MNKEFRESWPTKPRAQRAVAKREMEFVVIVSSHAEVEILKVLHPS